MLRRGDSPSCPIIISDNEADNETIVISSDSESELDSELNAEEATASNTTPRPNSPLSDLCTQINKVCATVYPASQLIPKIPPTKRSPTPTPTVINNRN